MGAQDGWMNEAVKTRLGRGDQLAGRPMDRLSLGRPSCPSDEQRVARPYRSGDQTAGQNSTRRSRRDRPTLARNSGLEGGNPGYAGGMRIELITTGSELLLGQVLNSHPGYLSGRLATMGLELARQTAVPDGKEAIAEVLGEAWKRSDLVIVTGVVS